MTPPERLAASDAEVDVLGVRVHMLDETAALGRIERIHDLGPPRFVSYVNPHTVNLASRDRAFAATLACADTRLADGFGIRIAARRQRVRVPAILNGSDFNVAVLRRAAARGRPVFLLGGQSRVAERAAERLSEPAWMNRAGLEWTFRLATRAATPGPSIPRRQPGVPRSRTAPRGRQRHAGAHTDLSRVGMGPCGALVTTSVRTRCPARAPRPVPAARGGRRGGQGGRAEARRARRASAGRSTRPGRASGPRPRRRRSPRPRRRRS